MVAIVGTFLAGLRGTGNRTPRSLVACAIKFAATLGGLKVRHAAMAKKERHSRAEIATEHFDAAEWAPFTASIAPDRHDRDAPNVRFASNSGQTLAPQRNAA